MLALFTEKDSHVLPQGTVLAWLVAWNKKYFFGMRLQNMHGISEAIKRSRALRETNSHSV